MIGQVSRPVSVTAGKIKGSSVHKIRDSQLKERRKATPGAFGKRK